MEHFREIAPDAPNQSFRDFLGKWNFPGDRAFEPVDGFSGGERARPALALIARQQPNVLLLDEPTNHLDLEMREALAEALATFEGAIVMVSHDRHLIGLVCDTYWRVADGVVEPFDGDTDAYAAWLRTRPQAQGTKARMEQVEEPVVVKTAPVAQVVQKKPVNPHKLAAAEAKVAELEVHWPSWTGSWPTRPTTPMPRAWRYLAVTAKPPPRSWKRPKPHGWNCSSPDAIGSAGPCPASATDRKAAGHGPALPTSPAFHPCACSHSRNRFAGSRSARERSRVSQ